jgi:hypothetical protein
MKRVTFDRKVAKLLLDVLCKAGEVPKCESCGQEVTAETFGAAFAGGFYHDFLPCLIALSDKLAESGVEV